MPEVIVAVDGERTVLAQRRYAAGGGGRGNTWTCHYFGMTANPGTGMALTPDIDSGPITPEPGDLTDLVCNDEHGILAYEQIFTFDPANPFGGIASAADAAAEARNTLPLPDPGIRTAPPLGAAQLVGVATWLWLDDPWRPLQASATLGGVTATVTATPTHVDWDPGDGTGHVTCDGPGTAFDPAHPGRTSTCTHTYRTRSTTVDADGTYPLTATVTYDIAWTATNGQTGTLDPLTRTATVPVMVREAQAVIR